MLSDLFPDERLKIEVMTRAAESLFCCKNTHKYFVQLYGEGNNGKTTLLRILHTAFPRWVQMPDVQHLVARTGRNADAPQPWLVDVMGSRILGFEEPPRGAKFDGSLLKLLRGNGVVTGRGLYKGNVSYVPSYTLWFATNARSRSSRPTKRCSARSIRSRCRATSSSRGERRPWDGVCEEEGAEHRGAVRKRPHKLALFAVLCDYYKRYVSDGLPPMECRFSQTLTSIYTEEHPGIEDLLDCVYEDEGSVVPEKQIVAEMRNRGTTKRQRS